MREGAERARDAFRAPTRDDAGETRGAVEASAQRDDIAIDRARACATTASRARRIPRV